MTSILDLDPLAILRLIDEAARDNEECPICDYSRAEAHHHEDCLLEAALTVAPDASIVWVSPWGTQRGPAAPPVYHLNRECLTGGARRDPSRRIPTRTAAARAAGLVPCDICEVAA